MQTFTRIFASSGSQIFPRPGLHLKAGTIIQKDDVFVTLTKPAVIQGKQTTIYGDGQGRDKKEIVYTLSDISWLS